MIGGIGIPELLLIFGILVLLFGAKKLPEIGRGLGEGIKSFKDAMTGEKKEEEQIINAKEIEAEVSRKEGEVKAKEKTTA